MTNAIGRNTCNLSVNVPRSTSAIITLEALRKMQAGKFRSVGAYVRHLLLIGLESDSPTAALRLREIRNAALAAVLLLVVCVSTLLSWLDSADDEAMRRARGQRVRVVRSGRARFDVEAA